LSPLVPLAPDTRGVRGEGFLGGAASPLTPDPLHRPPPPPSSARSRALTRTTTSRPASAPSSTPLSPPIPFPPPPAPLSLSRVPTGSIITEGLTDEQYIADYTEGFDDRKSKIMDFTPEKMEPICGIAAETIREVARMYARAKSSIIFWGMGISQHTHGTDNARCLISLALMTGQIGRRGTGLHPLRGQNNVQGASDVGLIPMMYPDYKRVDNREAQRKFEELWGTVVDGNKLTTKGMTGSRFAAGSAVLAARRLPSGRCFLFPTAITA